MLSTYAVCDTVLYIAISQTQVFTMRFMNCGLPYMFL